jgi:hypothetical protein
MKIKKYKSLKNKSKSFSLYFSPSWEPKKKHHFLICSGNNELHLGGREARMLKAFLDKVY